jgi:hypothetical protein
MIRKKKKVKYYPLYLINADELRYMARDNNKVNKYPFAYYFK